MNFLRKLSGSIIVFAFVVTVLGKNIHQSSEDTLCNCEDDDRIISCSSKTDQKNFSMIDHTKVETLKLSHYFDIPPRSLLQKFNRLRYLSLEHINTTKIFKFAFDDLPNLVSLSVTQSYITSVYVIAFNKLPALISLNLAMNRILLIHEDAFAELAALETLNLVANEITELRDGTFSKLLKLKKLTLMANPLKKLQRELFPPIMDNFLTEDSIFLFPTDRMDCGCHLMWVIEIYKKVLSPLNQLSLKSNKCWLVWNRQDLINLDHNERCSKFRPEPTTFSYTTRAPSTKSMNRVEEVEEVTTTMKVSTSISLPSENNNLEKFLKAYPIENYPLMNNTFGRYITNSTINIFFNFYPQKTGDKQ